MSPQAREELNKTFKRFQRALASAIEMRPVSNGWDDLSPPDELNTLRFHKDFTLFFPSIGHLTATKRREKLIRPGPHTREASWNLWTPRSRAPERALWYLEKSLHVGDSDGSRHHLLVLLGRSGSCAKRNKAAHEFHLKTAGQIECL